LKNSFGGAERSLQVAFVRVLDVVVVGAAAVGFVSAVGTVVGAVAELFETDTGSVRYAQQFPQRTLFRIRFRFDCYRRLGCFRQYSCFRLVARTVELVGSIFTVEIAIADPLAGNTDAVVLTLESVVLAKDRGAVELVGIVAAVVGSVADAAQRNAGKAVLTGELSLAVYRARYAEMNETLRRIVGRTLGYVAAEFVGRVGTVR